MKMKLFFFAFFLIPTLLFGLNRDQLEKKYQLASEEVNKSMHEYGYFQKIPNENFYAKIEVMNSIITHFINAIKYYDEVINDAPFHSKDKWYPELKEKCEKAKNNASNNLETCHGIQDPNLETYSNLKLNEAQYFFLLGGQKEHECIRNLYNVDEVVRTLTAALELYRQAATSAREALNALNLISKPIDKVHVEAAVQYYDAIVQRCSSEAADWAVSVQARKESLRKQLSSLQTEADKYEKSGMPGRALDNHRLMANILQELMEEAPSKEAEFLTKQLAAVNVSIDRLASKVDALRRTATQQEMSPEAFSAQEESRREAFYNSNILYDSDRLSRELLNRPFALPLDGQQGNNGSYQLNAGQFCRFLLQHNAPIAQLNVQVQLNGRAVHNETIKIPSFHTLEWHKYLTEDGMVIIPETKLKTVYGIHLRVSVVPDARAYYSLIVSHKGDREGYKILVSINKSPTLYDCNFIAPLPWQIGAYNPPSTSVERSIPKTAYTSKAPSIGKSECKSVKVRFSKLDALVEKLKRDPMAIAQYVQNEITFVDQFLIKENGVFLSPPIVRNEYTTFLDGQGSPWEQCQLLVYLLRYAGYQALYAQGEASAIPREYAEKLFHLKLPEDEDALVQYPWVVFYDGKEWISLFPWLKEMEISVGQDLYNYMPDKYASADRWILQYLKSDSNILIHKEPDENDTAGVLFVRFVDSELRKQGLSRDDVGMRRTQRRNHYSSWSEFPRPLTKGTPSFSESIDTKLLAQILLDINSHENPEKVQKLSTSLADLSGNSLRLHFTPEGAFNHVLHIGQGEGKSDHLLSLDSLDMIVDIKIQLLLQLGSNHKVVTRLYQIPKGTFADLCFHTGSPSPSPAFELYDKFSKEQDDVKRLHALLSFMGASYFERCSRSEHNIASLHRILPRTYIAFGLAKLTPDISQGPVTGTPILKFPQVDMTGLMALSSSDSFYGLEYEEMNVALMQHSALTVVDGSSNEHLIIKEIFQDPYATSTVRLLQLAHLEHEKRGMPGVGFLTLSPDNISQAVKNGQFKDIQKIYHDQWNSLIGVLNYGALNNFSYAYLTPGATKSADGTRTEMGSLGFNPYANCSLISNGGITQNGGNGTALTDNIFGITPISDWRLQSLNGGYILTTESPNQSEVSRTSTTMWEPDVRPEHKNIFEMVADPVDVVTGAFYIDEVELIVPGLFPLSIRRNYNSQNPLQGNLGCGWKLSLNPYLIEQDGKKYAAEEDGTVIAYSYNSQNKRWEVNQIDNPELSNGSSNPFNAYIQGDILYGTDGSKRTFQGGLLRTWVNATNNNLTFKYDGNRLIRIESNTGAYCGFDYNHEGMISEVFSYDGRRIRYKYSSQGDLTEVILPNDAVIAYDYDSKHRVIRETKSHGRVLENDYDELGRVIEQRSPVGQMQKMIPTAIFEYKNNMSIVTDSGGGCTTYFIHDKRIYKIIDPLGNRIFQTWYLDEKSWFDPQTEKIVSDVVEKGYPKSLKASTDKRGLTTSYKYDKRGNVKEITIQGEDLTGDGTTTITQFFSYNERDLCIREICGDQTKTITYDVAFPYLPKRSEKFWGSQSLSYVEWKYNSYGQVDQEDRSGAKTLWKYDNRHFPAQKTQISGTDDPNVVTEYTYDLQGNCKRIVRANGSEVNDYDIMGNKRQALTYAPDGTLLDASFIAYDLNNEVITIQKANDKNIMSLDYNASGRIKSTRHYIGYNKIAYTLCEYDSRGNLIQEVDPLNHTTYRKYNDMCQLISETKVDHCTHYLYESGGLVEKVISPSGATTTCKYTTNGLIKEEVYPDMTRRVVVYDIFGRPIKTIKNNILWEIEYDDEHQCVIQKHVETGRTTFQHYDSRGNVIRITDTAGYSTERTYDHLGRIKSETAPNGEQTHWRYNGNVITCKLPSGERHVQHYKGDKVVQKEVFNAKDQLLESVIYSYDPVEDKQEERHGDQIITTWMNAQGLPSKTKQGDITIQYEYDLCGNCIQTIDGEGYITRQQYDGLQRLVQEELSDGSKIKYEYDLDSNLRLCHLPNDTKFKVDFDLMGRKLGEEIQSGGKATQRWEYTYSNGYLTQKTDPLKRVHTYQYDTYGRVTQEQISGWKRQFTYDLRGLLTLIEQSQGEDKSTIERHFDECGKLVLEMISRNDRVIQRTEQLWTPTSRSLRVDNHQRNFLYQNNQLIQVSTPETDLAYSYTLSGTLKQKTTPLSTITTSFNASSRPEKIRSINYGGVSEQNLLWDRKGKLISMTTSQEENHFAYTCRGHLQSVNDGVYEFDFGGEGNGVLTATPNGRVYGFDAYGKIVEEDTSEGSMDIVYDEIGQVISYNDRQFTWDPWGQLIKVTDRDYSWEATYDGLGRRIETCYTPVKGASTTTISLYDPQAEFQEIGIRYDDRTFWKVFGPSGCDAVIDDLGEIAFLEYNALGHLTTVITPEGSISISQEITPYGPLKPFIPQELSLKAVASSLCWHSKSQDPTGLIWMGARYYDPQSGRFLSPDPIGHPLNLDLYAYANGDPINFWDPDGRFASSVYQILDQRKADGANEFRVSFYDGFEDLFPGCVPSHIYDLKGTGRFDLPSNLEVCYVNGMDTTFEGALQNLMYLSGLSGGYNLSGVYNATHGKWWDTAECTIGLYLGIATAPVRRIHQKIYNFCMMNSGDTKILFTVHSQGAIHMRNALMTLPHEFQQRVLVVAIAPAAYIDDSLCHSVVHYKTPLLRDMIPHFDRSGGRLSSFTIVNLESHKDAKFFDHSFQSPTYSDVLQDHMNSYVKSGGASL